jgi:hypothetical protein
MTYRNQVVCAWCGRLMTLMCVTAYLVIVAAGRERDFLQGPAADYAARASYG